jgi:hypothetical protein
MLERKFVRIPAPHRANRLAADYFNPHVLAPAAADEFLQQKGRPVIF